MDLLLELNVRMDFVRHEDSSVTPLVTTWLNSDGPHGQSIVLNEIVGEATTARALRCGEAATWWLC